MTPNDNPEHRSHTLVLKKQTYAPGANGDLEVANTTTLTIRPMAGAGSEPHTKIEQTQTRNGGGPVALEFLTDVNVLSAPNSSSKYVYNVAKVLRDDHAKMDLDISAANSSVTKVQEAHTEAIASVKASIDAMESETGQRISDQIGAIGGIDTDRQTSETYFSGQVGSRITDHFASVNSGVATKIGNLKTTVTVTDKNTVDGLISAASSLSSGTTMPTVRGALNNNETGELKLQSDAKAAMGASIITQNTKVTNAFNVSSAEIKTEHETDAPNHAGTSADTTDGTVHGAINKYEADILAVEAQRVTQKDNAIHGKWETFKSGIDGQMDTHEQGVTDDNTQYTNTYSNITAQVGTYLNDLQDKWEDISKDQGTLDLRHTTEITSFQNKVSSNFSPELGRVQGVLQAMRNPNADDDEYRQKQRAFESAFQEEKTALTTDSGNISTLVGSLSTGNVDPETLLTVNSIVQQIGQSQTSIDGILADVQAQVIVAKARFDALVRSNTTIQDLLQTSEGGAGAGTNNADDGADESPDGAQGGGDGAAPESGGGTPDAVDSPEEVGPLTNVIGFRHNSETDLSAFDGLLKAEDGYKFVETDTVPAVGEKVTLVEVADVNDVSFTGLFTSLDGSRGFAVINDQNNGENAVFYAPAEDGKVQVVGVFSVVLGSGLVGIALDGTDAELYPPTLTIERAGVNGVAAGSFVASDDGTGQVMYTNGGQQIKKSPDANSWQLITDTGGVVDIDVGYLPFIPQQPYIANVGDVGDGQTDDVFGGGHKLVEVL